MPLSRYRGVGRELTALALAALLAAAGCGAPRAREPGYRTLADAPGRDAALARRLSDQAIDRLAEGKPDEAEALVRRALDADVTFGPAHNTLGRIYFDSHKLYLAAWEFQYAIKLMPYLPEPKNNLGLVLEEVGKLDEAVEQYRQATAVAPDNPELLGNMARASVLRGDRDERVRELLEEVVLKDPRPEWTDWAGEQLALMGGPRPRSQPHPQSRPTPRPTDLGGTDDDPRSGDAPPRAATRPADTRENLAEPVEPPRE